MFKGAVALKKNAVISPFFAAPAAGAGADTAMEAGAVPPDMLADAGSLPTPPAAESMDRKGLCKKRVREEEETVAAGSMPFAAASVGSETRPNVVESANESGVKMSRSS